MRYLGRISGNALLTRDGDPVGRATYDFDGFAAPRGGIVSSGEIQLSPRDLGAVFGRRGVRLVTDDGRLLDIKFSDKVLRSTQDVAHVDVTGDLPDTPALWRR